MSEPGETDQNANPFTEYTVTLVADSASSLLQFTFVDPPGYFGLDDVSVTPVCYCRGTRILTERGEVAVEDLAEGDRVVTLSGRGPVLKPVTWLGRRRIDAARHPRADEIHPIRIKADAFAAGVPHRDLLVSPGHAISVDGVLMTAKRLVNGVTIIQDRPIAEVEYFHVELAEHDLLLAEGLAAESYYDSGNRHFFENNGGPVELHGGPDDERLPATPRFRMTNAGNGVSEERRRRVEHATRQVRGKGLEQRYGSADFRCTTGTALFGMSNRKKAG